MSYYIRASNRRKFTVEELGKTLYSVVFPNWTKAHAIARLNNAEYTFDKTSFLCSSRTIYKNNAPIGSMSFNWIGHLYLNLTTEKGEDLLYVLKLKGLFWKRVELVDRGSQNLLLTMHQESNWFIYNYRIEELNTAAIRYPLIELLGILGVGATLLRDRNNNGS